MTQPSSFDSRTFLLYIDTRTHGDPSGRYYNPGLSVGGSFRGMAQLLQAIENCLNINDSPQAFHTLRSFMPAIHQWSSWDTAVYPHRGKLATFRLQVIFRRNASWQGVITWQETNQTQHFRSALELMHLIGSVLNSHPPAGSIPQFGIPPRERLEG